jgi:NADH-quinone oxidoreductase subunit E
MSDLRWLTDYNSWSAKGRVWGPIAAIVAFLFFLLIGWGWFLALVVALLALVAVVWFTRDDSAGVDSWRASAPPAPPTTPAPPVSRAAPVEPAAEVAVEAAVTEAAAAEAVAAEATASERVRAAARAAGEAARMVDSPLEAVRPERLDAPRGGVADDLKKIKGVGPKLEATLHSLGIFHFDQIAAWTEGELAWVDSHLEGFNERATRDAWVDQARVLTTGGETEFSRRVDKGEVY